MSGKTQEKPKLTRNQTLVLDALAGAGQPLGAYALLEVLRDNGFKAPLQVYRALDQVIDLKLVLRLESLNAWTVCCKDHHNETPVFAICDDCGSVTQHFHDGLIQNLKTISRRNGFTPDRSVIEIHGQCDNCCTDAEL